MAAAVDVQTVVPGGLNPTYNAASTDGHKFINDGKTIVHVKNAHSAPIVLTVKRQFTADGASLPDRTVSVPNAQERICGPFETSIYSIKEGADRGMVEIDFDIATNITFAVHNLPS